MIIKRIKAKNFKSFRELDVELGDFNIIIGANASGKSNFIQIFKFLKDMVTYGLDNAVSIQGGAEYLANMSIGPAENLSLQLVFDVKKKPISLMGLFVQKTSISTYIKVNEITYDLELQLKRRGGGVRIAKETLTLKCDFGKIEKSKKKRGDRRKVVEHGQIVISRSNGGKIKVQAPESASLAEEQIIFRFLIGKQIPSNILLLQIPLFFPPMETILDNIAIYDFDPKLPKRATPITGKLELEEDGSNLSIILKNITRNKETRRKLFNLVSDLLPFISSLDVEKFADKSLLFKLKEKYFKHYLPASMISDGTINITALIIALYFEKKALTIIEEPERNIHPYLISKVVDMMKDASRNKQIIVTTHNPEIVKYAGLENILLISRDDSGFSSISRPTEKEQIRKFLENEIGIEELYVQNLLN
ncbi:ATPase [Thermococci archaeon]|nr:MAG: ATPase [Thermococci archaeon]